MRTRRNIGRCAGVLLFAFLLVSVASAARAGDGLGSRNTPTHAANAVASIATGVSNSTLTTSAPSHRALFGTLFGYIVAALTVALVRALHTRDGLSSRALLARAGLGRRGRSPPFVRS
jgi:hypothetical protein